MRRHAKVTSAAVQRACSCLAVGAARGRHQQECAGRNEGQAHLSVLDRIETLNVEAPMTAGLSQCCLRCRHPAKTDERFRGYCGCRCCTECVPAPRLNQATARRVHGVKCGNAGQKTGLTNWCRLSSMQLPGCGCCFTQLVVHGSGSPFPHGKNCMLEVAALVAAARSPHVFPARLRSQHAVLQRLLMRLHTVFPASRMTRQLGVCMPSIAGYVRHR